MDSTINYEVFFKTIENRNHTRVCRFCLVDANNRSFSARTIGDLFKTITNADLLVSPDYPTFVCIKCEKNLRTAAQIRNDIIQMETFWNKFIDELPLIEEIKIEDVDDEEISFETVEMVIEPMYTSTILGDDFDVKTDFEAKVQGNASDEYNIDDDFDSSNDPTDFGNSLHEDSILKISPKLSKNNCQYCEVTDLTQNELRQHQRNCHPGIVELPNFTCDVCEKTYSSRHGIRTHMKRHMQHRPNEIQRSTRYKCSVCDKTFTKKSQLDEHDLTHSGITPHICHICGIGKKSRHLMNNHLKSHDPDYVSNKKPTKQTNKQKSSKRYYTCWLCPTRIDFKCLDELKSHRKNLHHKFECEFCKNGFMTNEALQSHILIHRTQDRPHVCKFCGGTFSKIGHLNSHIQGKHALRKPHPCDKCPKGFVHRYQLQSHIRIFHDKIKAFHCTECGLSFGHAKSRVWHMRTVHKM